MAYNETMSKSDLSTRRKAIPFRANWYDSDSVGNKFPDVSPFSDLYNLSTGYSSNIRLAVPAAGDLVQLRLTLQAINTSASTQVSVSLGRFAADGINVDTTMTDAERAIITRKIMGDDSPLVFPAGTPILLDSLDLLKALPKEGEPYYNRNGFVLYLGITTANRAGWSLRTFKVDGSVQMGVL